MTVRERLDLLFESSEASQSEVARRLGVSPAAVSAWRKGERAPSTKNLKALAELFEGASFSWLAEGEGRYVPDLTSARKAYRQEIQWIPRPAPPDGGKEFGSAAATGFLPSVEAAAFEATQNINDGRQPNEPTVHAQVTGIRLSGPDLHGFLEAMRFDQLERHLKAAAQGENKLAKRLRAGLSRLEESDELTLLRFDDYGGVGLTGEEWGDGHFAALVRNVLDTQKHAGAGGSHGLGKATFWAASELGTVLFNSVLSKPTEARLADRRVIGRAELPWHELDDGTRLWGPMWLGGAQERDGAGTKVAVSYWGNRALTMDLCLERDNGQPGTSVLIVGLRDPSGQSEDLEELLTAIAEAIGKRFFPALLPDGPGEPPVLRATVRTAEGRKDSGELHITSQREVGSVAAIEPVADALRQFRAGEAVEQLENPGEVVAVKVPIRIPPRKVAPTHDKFEHEVTLLVRAAGDDDSADLVNSVLFTRGARMVVSKYSPQSLGLGVRKFHALLLAGEANGDAQEDIWVERFLRVAEPPAHDSWGSTPELGTDYERGGPARILELERSVRVALKEVVGVEPRDLSDGPQALKNLLRIKTHDAPVSKGPDIHQLVGRFDAGAASWVVEKAVVSVPRISGEWSFQPVLLLESESGGGTRVGWADEGVTVSPDTCRVDSGYVIVPGGTRRVTLSGRTDPNQRPEGLEHARATIALKNIKSIGG